MTCRSSAMSVLLGRNLVSLRSSASVHLCSSGLSSGVGRGKSARRYLCAAEPQAQPQACLPSTGAGAGAGRLIDSVSARGNCLFRTRTYILTKVHSHSTSPVDGDQTDHVQCLAAVGVARADRATCWIAMIRKTGPGERLSGHWGPWKLGWEAHARWASAGTYRLGERVDLPATPIRRPTPLRPLRMRTVSSTSTSSCTL